MSALQWHGSRVHCKGRRGNTQPTPDANPAPRRVDAPAVSTKTCRLTSAAWLLVAARVAVVGGGRNARWSGGVAEA